MTEHQPTLAEAKRLAKDLRAQRERDGTAISHAEALERVAKAHGFRDWNGFHAAIRETAPAGWSVGGRLTGRYLSQPFAATVLASEQVRPGWFRLTLDLDEAVDVVQFDSFSNRRKRLQAVIGPEGRTRECTSDGKAHLQLDG